MEHTYMRTPVILRWMVVIGAFALAGCSGERATESVTERAVVATYAAAENTPDLEVFTVDISGDVSLAMPPGEIRYETMPETTVAGEAIPAHRALVMMAELDGQRVEVRLQFASDLETGSHEIDAGAFDALRAQVAAGLGQYGSTSGPTAEDAVWYNNAVDGSLTLEDTGDTISGHFSFTAETMRDVEGTETPSVVMVAGTFEDVPLVGGAEATDTPTDEPAAVRSAEPTAEVTEAAS
jgi:hypothetical protein